MNFADEQQRLDLRAALRRLRLLASHHELDDRRLDDLTPDEFCKHIAELRNIEQVLVSISNEVHDRTFLAEPSLKPREARDFGATIDRMLAVIPECMTHLRALLEKAKYDDAFRAPELRAVSWSKTQALLRSNVGDPKQDWEKRIAAIWRGES